MKRDVSSETAVALNGGAHAPDQQDRCAQPTTLWTSTGLTNPSWYTVVNPCAFVLFMVANMAEVGRSPFDVPEIPTEIVASYQTVYSSVYFVVTYLGEFIEIR